MFQILNNIFSLQIDRLLALKRLMKPRQQVASLQLILSMNKYVLEEYETLQVLKVGLTLTSKLCLLRIHDPIV